MRDIDAMIRVEQGSHRMIFKIGVLLTDGQPPFEMREGPGSARKANHDAIDQRFAFTNYPSQLYLLHDEIKDKIASLPPSSSLCSDGKIFILDIPANASAAKVEEARDIARALALTGEKKLLQFTSIAGAQEQPRVRWDNPPDPQVLVSRRGVTVEISVSWRNPIHLSTRAPDHLPAGRLSIGKDGFSVDDEAPKLFFSEGGDDPAKLLAQLERAGGQVLAAELDGEGSLGSKARRLSIMVYPDNAGRKIEAAIELLTRMALLEDPSERDKRALDSLIDVREEQGRTIVSVGPVLLDEGPALKMYDETLTDKLKKPFIKDYKVNQREVDQRFFITGHPGIFWELPEAVRDEVYSRLMALPNGSVIEMGGRITKIELPLVSDEATKNATKILKALAKNHERIALIAETPGVQRRPRVAWDVCPDPQFTLTEGGVSIEIRVLWSSVELRTQHSPHIPDGSITFQDDTFSTQGRDEDLLLLRDVERAALSVGATAPFGAVSNLKNHGLKVSLVGGLTPAQLRAAIDLIFALVSPRDGGPFR
jgi:hypothetical protein